MTIQDMINKEADLKVQPLNGENNGKLVSKDKKNSWEYKYTSTTRTVLRNLWLVDFLYIMMDRLYEEPTASLSHCAKEAYNGGLGPHHPWVVR